VEGYHLNLLRQCQNMKGNYSIDRDKTKHTKKYAHKSCNLKTTKDKHKAKPGRVNCFC